MQKYLIYHLCALFAGVVLDLIIGDPKGFPHPVVFIGKWIAHLERKLYPKDENNGTGSDKKIAKSAKRRGALLCGIVCTVTVVVTAALLFGAYLVHPYLGVAVEAILTCYILAAKSLYKESMKVYHALPEKSADAGFGDADANLQDARAALSMIVGRDTQELGIEKIVAAAVETVAENTSDGVIAPLLYTAIGGPVLGMLYKAVNTMDSMIGYKNERYLHFGRAAAKLDDVCNFLPARISAWLMIAFTALAGIFDRHYDAAGARRIFARDRYNHSSPNSAQTESVCAGALGIRLGGPSYYFGKLVEKPCLGDETRGIEAADIRRANVLMFGTEGIAVLLVLLIAAMIVFMV